MVIYQGIVSKYKTVPMKRFRVGQPSHRFRWRVALQNLLGNTECDLVEEKIELIDSLMIIKSVNWQELLVTVSPAHTMDGKTAMYTPSPPYAASQSKSGITGTSTLRRTSEISPSDCIRGEFKWITNQNVCLKKTSYGCGSPSRNVDSKSSRRVKLGRWAWQSDRFGRGNAQVQRLC
jgi:hypothetical protein